MRLFLVSLSLLTGCVAQLQRLAAREDGASTSGDIHYIKNEHGHRERVGPYWGPECERIEAPTEPIRGHFKDADPTEGKQPNLAHDPTDQVLRLVCVDTIMSLPREPERNTWVMQHFRFDELEFDHFTASLMLVQCLEANACLGAPHVVRPKHDYQNPYLEKERAKREAEPPPVHQFYGAGMMRWYAERVDPAEVTKRLATLALPQAARDTYLRLLDTARKAVVEMTNRLTPDGKALFVDIPMQTFARRAAEHGKSSKHIAELRALGERVTAERAAQGVSNDTLARLVKLRLAYEATCKKDCTRGAIFAAITKQLFWAYVSRGDAPAAMAEAKLLDKLDPSAAEEIAELQTKAIGDARGRLARVESARNQGLDADAARSTANGSVLDLEDGRYVYRPHRDFAVQWASLIPSAKLGPIDGKVAGVEQRGATAIVRFQDMVTSWEQSTGCRETGRIDSIDRNGKIHYREECTGSKKRTERHKVPPVTMPASEAAGLAPGDEIYGFTSFGPNQERVGGRIWVVRRGNKLVRVRDVPL